MFVAFLEGHAKFQAREREREREQKVSKRKEQSNERKKVESTAFKLYEADKVC